MVLLRLISTGEQHLTRGQRKVDGQRICQSLIDEMIKENLSALEENLDCKLLYHAESDFDKAKQVLFRMSNEEKGIIPCSGRELHKDCYMVTVRFTKAPETFTNNTKLIFLVLIIVLALVVFVFYKRKPKLIPTTQEDIYETIGRYKFYPEQNKLIKEAIEISLSKKECELLSIFIAKPNQIIKRDELTKKVWEDNGVFVSRSLDTYISKLRKKLQEDPSIKLTNIHGIGYKLEI